VKRWSEDEINWLIENYPILGKVSCANFLNKSIASIRAKASNLNLKQDRDSLFYSEWQAKAAQSKIGKKRPEQAKVINQLREQNKLKMTKEGKLRNAYSRGAQGRRADIDNIYFRSSWEANYARYLNFLKSKGNIYKWEFEPDTFWFEKIKRGVRSYLPDFKIWETEASTPYYVEIKGWMDDKSKTKLKRMKKYYPHVRIYVVEKKQYTEIKNKLGRAIAGWE